MGKHRHHHSPRAERRSQFAPAAHQGRGRRGVSWNTLIIAGGLVLVAVAILSTRSGPGGGVGFALPGVAAAELVPTGQDVAMPVSTFADGKARFYRYVTTAGREIRFFMMKSSDGVVRAAFDSCDVCFRERKGYRQAGDNMICNNCGKAFPSNRINVLQGGCNPAPIERTVEGDRVLLRAAALEQGANYF